MKCICGCDLEIIKKPSHKYYTPKFIIGHQNIGRRSPNRGRFYKKTITSKFTGYDRSKKVLSKRDNCSWKHIGHCKGPIQVCHINQNPLCNDLKNLIALCNSHHRLMDHGRIDPKNPKMPPFYTDGSGKRRYNNLPKWVFAKRGELWHSVHGI